jgi:hypothetical protein
LCKVPNFTKEYGLILAIIGALIVIILVVLICIGIFYCYRKSQKDDNCSGIKTLVADQTSVNVSEQTSAASEPKKPTLARERGFGQLKPTLKRIRTVDFKVAK